MSEPSAQSPMTVMWSGGYDSTALILHYLKEEPGRQLKLLAVAQGNLHSDQVVSEKKSRTLIYEILRKNPEYAARLELIETAWPVFTSCEGTVLNLPQPALWMYVAGALCATPEVAYGWVRGDDVWHFRHEVFSLLDALGHFTRGMSLHMPFEWKTKDELLSLYRGHFDIFQALSSCEDGKPWMLHDCAKCLELRRLAKKLKKEAKNG